MTAKEKLIATLVAMNIAIYLAFLHFPTLNSGYVWDDLIILSSIASTKENSNPTTVDMFKKSNFYRPLGNAAFHLENKATGTIPSISHAINISLHIAVILLLYFLLLTTVNKGILAGRRIFFSAAATLLIGTLPTLAEPATWVSDRFETIYAFCALLAIATQLSNLDTRTKSIWMFIFVFCSLLAKETAIIILPAYVALDAIKHWQDYNNKGTPGRVKSSEFLAPLMSIILAIILYAALRTTTLDGGLVKFDPAASAPLNYRIKLISDTIAINFKLLMFPWQNIQPFYASKFSDRASNTDLLMLGSFCLLTVSLSIQLLKRKSRFYCVPLLLIASLAPALNFLPINPGLFSTAPRYLYGPVLVTSLALWLAINTKKKPETFLLLITAVALASAYPNFHFTRNFASKYETDETFWDWAIKTYGPFNYVVASNGIGVKTAFEKYDEAYKILEQSKNLFQMPKDELDLYEFEQKYYNGLADKSLLDEINNKIENSSHKGQKDEDDTNKLASLYNIKTLIMADLCEPSAEIKLSAQKSYEIKETELSKMLILTFDTKSPFSVKTPPRQDSTFTNELIKRFGRRLQLGINKCRKTGKESQI